jgi:hypothetical protein
MWLLFLLVAQAYAANNTTVTNDEKSNPGLVTVGVLGGFIGLVLLCLLIPKCLDICAARDQRKQYTSPY